jgi:hypothetical protein
MKPWTDLFRRPARLTTKSAEAWFARIADHLLNHSRWMIAGTPHRLVDIEFYYRGPGLVDPFVHGNPIMAKAGLWYFHRTGGSYRGGSFKGIDLTFGDGKARGGILFRAAEAPDGRLIDGPSLLVDRAIRWCRVETVSELDEKIAERSAWHPLNPIRIIPGANLGKAVLACSRVGLTLRRAKSLLDMPNYLFRQYRFVTEPKAIAKGKAQIVMALHRQGYSSTQIKLLTGSPLNAIERYVAEYAIGRMSGRIEDFTDKVLAPVDICRLHGIADRR